MGAIVTVLTPGAGADRAAAQRMLAAAPHRGPNHEVVVQGDCALGVSHTDGMPDASIAVADGWAAAFVGDLDNHAELTGELTAGDDGSATTPASIVLAAFRRHGPQAPDLMRGPFAAAVTDGRSVWCFRDHAAFGQLFYRQEPSSLYAATEPKQVVAGARIPSEPDLDVVERIFYGDIDDDIPCALRGVTRVPKGHVLTADGQRVRAHRYWDPAPLLESARLSTDEVVERFDELMHQAVARTLRGGDVISLSGGIDSPAVAAFAAPEHRRRYGESIGALSMVFPDFPSVDERPYIEAVCEQHGIRLHTFEPTARPLDRIEEWALLCDGPIPVLPPEEVAEDLRLARSLGYQRMLTGEHAEFVFDRRPHFAGHLLVHGRVRALARYLRQEREDGRTWQRIVREVIGSAMPCAIVRYRKRRYGYRGPQAPAWLDPDKLIDLDERSTIPPRRRWAEEQLAFSRGTSIGLEAEEVCEAVCGVRVRRPWADIDLYEFFLSLPAEVKFPRIRRKTLVRSLLRGKLPDLVLDRHDKTFFNEHIMSRIDYDTFKRLLVRPRHRLDGVDYDLLADRIESNSLSLGEYKWAVDLAKSHAFLNRW